VLDEACRVSASGRCAPSLENRAAERENLVLNGPKHATCPTIGSSDARAVGMHFASSIGTRKRAVGIACSWTLRSADD
jgi:hypothetical protein